jgi:hypothetical protein
MKQLVVKRLATLGAYGPAGDGTVFDNASGLRMT